MKRYHLLVAIVLVLPILFSCGGKKPHTPDNPTPDPTPVTPVTPVDPDPPTPPTPPEPEPEPPIEFRRTVRFAHNILSFNSNKDFVAVYEESLTKSGDSRKILTGTFTCSEDNKTLTMKDFGVLEVIDDKQVAFTPAGGTRKVYEAETSLIVENEKSEASLVNRSWTISKTVLYFRGANYTFNDGLNLNEVERIAREQGIEFKFHMNDNMVAKKLIVTDALIAATFENGESYAAEHTLRSGTKFNLDEFTYDLKGTAEIDFDDTDPNLCFISILTTLDGSDAEVEFTLKAVE